MVSHQTAVDELKDMDAAVAAVDRLTWTDSDRDERIGLEIEAFPMTTGSVPPARLPLYGEGGAVEIVEGYVGGTSTSRAFPVYQTGTGGQVSFEPGGQIEYSSSAKGDIPSLMTEVEGSWEPLEAAFRERGADLVCLGVDPWNHVDDVPQQHRAERYVAMDRYFSQRWPAGAVMMRNTCSMQVSLESGKGRVREERWLAANLMSPILTAMFSTSPDPGGLGCKRARVWQAMDPTRTGFPLWESVDRFDPLDDARRRALRANVMFVERSGEVRDVSPGLSFGEWVQSGHPEFGRPTADDLQTHLSTIFTEVRPRNGVLELRAVDSLPRRWWMVPAVVATGVLYDDEVRTRAIELMLPYAERLGAVWRTAAGAGLSAAELATTAGKLAQLAMEGAQRSDRVGRPALASAAEFVDRFTLRGRAPGEELVSTIYGGARASLDSQMGSGVGGIL